MNIKELSERLNETIKMIDSQKGIKISGTEHGTEHIPVVIELNEISIGPTACSEIKGASLGFDWNSGKFILHAEDKLIREKLLRKESKKIKRDGQLWCGYCSTHINETDKYCRHCGRELKDGK